MAAPSRIEFLEPAQAFRATADELFEALRVLDAWKQRVTVLAGQLVSDFDRATTRPTGAPLSLTPSEVAEQLRVSEDEVRRMVGRGELPSFRIGRLVRVPYAAVAEFVAARGEAQ
jgi:excisionase family DNA binding protein